MTYHTATLDNGLRIIHLPSTSQVIYCGYQIAAGTRHEASGKEGLAHFVEHATFKGTARRNSLQIIKTLENVGGELNAYTNKESTTYYAALMSDHLSRAVDLLSDIVFHSVYPDAEVEKEKEVVVEEIESYNDSPAELIYDEFDNILFRHHPLGHNILGTVDNVRNFTSADAKAFAQRHYRPSNAVFFAYGNIRFQQLLRQLNKHTADAEATSTPSHDALLPSNSSLQPCSIVAAPTLPLLESNQIVVHRNTHQAHVMIGTRAYGMNHPDYMALYLLNNIIGGPGMNSCLNLSLREKYGLVYTVESTMAAYTDTGTWSVYFGCDHADIDRCIRLVKKELQKLCRKPLTPSHLRQAKQQLKGQIGIASDNRESFALDFGRTYLMKGKEKDVELLFQQIDAVTSDDLQRIACELFADDQLLTLIYK